MTALPLDPDVLANRLTLQLISLQGRLSVVDGCGGTWRACAADGFGGCHASPERRIGADVRAAHRGTRAQATTEVEAAVSGTVLLIGDANSYGQAVLIEVLCSALSDVQPGVEITYENVVEGPRRICHFFPAIGRAGFAGGEDFAHRAGHMAYVIESGRSRTGGAPPRLPRRRVQAARREILARGTRVLSNLKVALTQAATILDRHSDNEMRPRAEPPHCNSGGERYTMLLALFAVPARHHG